MKEKNTTSRETAILWITSLLEWALITSRHEVLKILSIPGAFAIIVLAARNMKLPGSGE